jgi:hypothetical protein
VSKGRGTMEKTKSESWYAKDEHDVRRGELPFVRSLVRFRRGVKRMTMEVKKSKDEGKKEQKSRTGGKKDLVAKSGFEI